MKRVVIAIKSVACNHNDFCGCCICTPFFLFAGFCVRCKVRNVKRITGSPVDVCTDMIILTK